jgi:hypothetical protein
LALIRARRLHLPGQLPTRQRLLHPQPRSGCPATMSECTVCWRLSGFCYDASPGSTSTHSSSSIATLRDAVRHRRPVHTTGRGRAGDPAGIPPPLRALARVGLLRRRGQGVGGLPGLVPPASGRRRPRRPRRSSDIACVNRHGEGASRPRVREPSSATLSALARDVSTPTTMVANVASRRVLEKAGLRFVRTFHQPWPYRIDGEEKGDVE